ncbi:hypothetical protein [Aureitalea marina]|uniref:Uncharacterized protein n=1 Tax=Aureitalea marina TaxID=930804 RepID=A0A2S7KPW2_9FLAO|nr:hypothetical protein [Aureitalea marina]PQB04618.1 hypothetical protein BST85_06700 [Aureitalea marina]
MIYWQYFKGIVLLSVGIGVLLTAIFGMAWGFLFFVTLAPIGAHLLHGQFRPNERIFYLNAGISSWKLMCGSLLIQLIISVPVFLLLIGFYSMFFGGF